MLVMSYATLHADFMFLLLSIDLIWVPKVTLQNTDFWQNMPLKASPIVICISYMYDLFQISKWVLTCILSINSWNQRMCLLNNYQYGSPPVSHIENRPHYSMQYNIKWCLTAQALGTKLEQQKHGSLDVIDKFGEIGKFGPNCKYSTSTQWSTLQILSLIIGVFWLWCLLSECKLACWLRDCGKVCTKCIIYLFIVHSMLFLIHLLIQI